MKKLLPLLLSLIMATIAAEPIVTGFFPVYRSLPANYDFSRLTHFIYFSLIPKGDGTFSWTSGRDSLTMYNTFQTVKERIGNGGTKVILSIGGTSEVGSGGFNEIAADETITTQFVSRVRSLLTEWGADGVDIDWEKHLQTKEDSDNHEAFLKSLHDTLKPEGFEILTDVSASSWGGQWFNDGFWNYVDYVQPMAYTFSGSWSTTTGHNGSYSQALSALSYWVGRGVPKNKLVLGVPFYGMGFGGTDQVGESFSGPSSLGQYVDYHKVLTALESGTYLHSTANDPDGPYIYRSDNTKEIIFYNDTTIMAKKAQYLLDEGYGGAMIWELGQDVEGKNSLLNVLAKNLLDWDDGTVSVMVKEREVSNISAQITGNTLTLSIPHMKSAQVMVVDVRGRLMQQTDNLRFNGGVGEVLLRSLASGMYFVSVVASDGKEAVISFVKQ